MMTTREVAQYLSLNEKKVYQLAGEGKLPATRLGGKWIFPRRLIEEWIIEGARQNLRIEIKPLSNHLVVMGSNDLAWEVLGRETAVEPYGLVISVANVGSTGGLMALGHGIAQVAGAHLLDPATGEYNIPCLSRYLPGRDVTVVNLFYRKQGLMVKRGNPDGIKDIDDLARSDVTFINRQEGSGTRVLLEAELARSGIPLQHIRGYDREVSTHLEVAIEIQRGEADVGMGVLSAARAVGLEFIPLCDERYDLIILREYLSSKPVQTLLEVIRSSRFRDVMIVMEGYGLKETGRVLWEGKV